MIPGYPFRKKKFWVKNELVWIGSPLEVDGRKSGICEEKRRFALEKLQLLSKLENPTFNQARSVEGALQWVSQMCPWLRPFLAGLYDFFENRKGFSEKLAGNSRLRIKNLGIVFKINAVPRPKNAPSK